MLETTLLFILVSALIAAIPTWPHSRGWGYYPCLGLGLLVLIVALLILLYRI
jgi:hypothetical protein